VSKIDWNLRVPTISINPEMATIEDIARMAADLMEANRALAAAQEENKRLTGCYVCENERLREGIGNCAENLRLYRKSLTLMEIDRTVEYLRKLIEKEGE